MLPAAVKLLKPTVTRFGLEVFPSNISKSAIGDSMKEGSEERVRKADFGES